MRRGMKRALAFTVLWETKKEAERREISTPGGTQTRRMNKEGVDGGGTRWGTPAGQVFSMCWGHHVRRWGVLVGEERRTNGWIELCYGRQPIKGDKGGSSGGAGIKGGA